MGSSVFKSKNRHLKTAENRQNRPALTLFVFFQSSSRASYEITRLFICFLSSSPVFRSVFSVSTHRTVAGHRHKEGLCPVINAKSARVAEEVSSPAATIHTASYNAKWSADASGGHGGDHRTESGLGQ
jgi:hypothetical protein